MAASLALGGDHMNGEGKGPSLTTRLTREFGVRYPFVCAGMAFVGMLRLPQRSRTQEASECSVWRPNSLLVS